MYPVLFKIGPITVFSKTFHINIYTYGFFIFLGILAGLIFTLKECKRAGLPKDKIVDLIFWSILAGFLSSRILYIIVNWKYFAAEPFTFILSGSGFVFYGAFFGGFAAILVLARKNNLHLGKTLDIIAPSFALGHSLGRIGCFFYGCCYGVHTSSFIGVVFPAGSPAASLPQPVIPTQIISSFFLMVIFTVLLCVRDRKTFDGQVVLTYIILYAFFRFIIEFYRGDPRGSFLSFSISQWLSLVLFGFGSFFLLRGIKKA